MGFGFFGWVEPISLVRIGARTAFYTDLLAIAGFYTDSLLADSTLTLEVRPAEFLSFEVGYRFVWSSYTLGEDQTLYGRNREFRFRYSMSAFFAGVNVKF